MSSLDYTTLESNKRFKLNLRQNSQWGDFGAKKQAPAGACVV